MMATTVNRRTVSLSDKPVDCDRRRYEDRCARIPSRPGAARLHEQAGYIAATGSPSPRSVPCNGGADHTFIATNARTSRLLKVDVYRDSQTSGERAGSAGAVNGSHPAPGRLMTSVKGLSRLSHLIELLPRWHRSLRSGIIRNLHWAICKWSRQECASAPTKFRP